MRARRPSSGWARRRWSRSSRGCWAATPTTKRRSSTPRRCARRRDAVPALQTPAAAHRAWLLGSGRSDRGGFCERFELDQFVAVCVDRARVAHAELPHDLDRLRVLGVGERDHALQAKRAEAGVEAGAGGFRGVPLAPCRPLELVHQLHVGAGAVDVDDAADPDHLAGLAELDRPEAEAVPPLALDHPRHAGCALLARARLAVGAHVAHDLRVAVHAVGAVDLGLLEPPDQEANGFDREDAQDALRLPAWQNGGAGTAEQCRTE